MVAGKSLAELVLLADGPNGVPAGDKGTSGGCAAVASGGPARVSAAASAAAAAAAAAPPPLSDVADPSSLPAAAAAAAAAAAPVLLVDPVVRHRIRKDLHRSCCNKDFEATVDPDPETGSLYRLLVG